MSAYQLGQRVTMSGTALKQQHQGHTMFIESGLPQRLDYPTTKTFTEGVIVGSRTVAEGDRESIDEYGYYFAQKVGSARRVWLVAFHLRRKPVMCFDHQVTAVTK